MNEPGPSGKGPPDRRAKHFAYTSLRVRNWFRNLAFGEKSIEKSIHNVGSYGVF